MSRTRKRIATPQQIKTLDEANLALSEIGALVFDLERIDGTAAEQIGKIKEKAAKDGEEKRSRIQELEAALALFSEYNKGDLFKDRKSVELSYGQIGYRMSTKISIRKTTLELLKQLFPGLGIRVKEEVDKEALKEWELEQLAQVDAAKLVEDAFYYEVNRDEVNKSLLKRGA